MEKNFFRIMTVVICLLWSIASMAQATNHVVKKGESLSSIANMYGVTVSQLQKANPNMGKVIYIGQVIIIPNVSKIERTNSDYKRPKQLEETDNHQVKTFSPAPELSAEELKRRVKKISPYTLYQKGNAVEYAFKPKLEGEISFLLETVADVRIEDGLLVAYIQSTFLNKNHNPKKGIPKSAREYWYPIEIDYNGMYHLTHNPTLDVRFLKEHFGYGLLIPGVIKVGDVIESSKQEDIASTAFGGNIKWIKEYTNWKAEKEEIITTPAGDFTCIKLRGQIQEKFGKFSNSNYWVTCWLARGIGIVRYEWSLKANDSSPMIMYLNKLIL